MISIDISDDLILRAQKRNDELYAYTDWSKHNKKSCNTCKILKLQEESYCLIAELNKLRITHGMEPIDEAYGLRVQGHCPICLSPLFEGDHWCSEKCYELWKNQKK